MSKIWRIAVAWLLALALPVQGYAAQTMLLCGPAHHQQSAAAAHDHAAHGHGDAAKSQNKAGKCSACASCCNAPALTGSLPTIELVAKAPQVAAILPVAHDRILIGGLDRPPRLSHA
nr:hypothetical protein [uncultured Roseateles sp.]